MVSAKCRQSLPHDASLTAYGSAHLQARATIKTRHYRISRSAFDDHASQERRVYAAKCLALPCFPPDREFALDPYFLPQICLRQHSWRRLLQAWRLIGRGTTETFLIRYVAVRLQPHRCAESCSLIFTALQPWLRLDQGWRVWHYIGILQEGSIDHLCWQKHSAATPDRCIHVRQMPELHLLQSHLLVTPCNEMLAHGESPRMQRLQGMQHIALIKLQASS